LQISDEMRQAQLSRACVIAFVISTAAPIEADTQVTESRGSLLAHAQVWRPTRVSGMNVRRGPAGPDAFQFQAAVRCQFVDKTLDGSSPKFACRLPSGDEVKVKYGDSNGEVHGEVAASRLLWALGFGADAMYPVRLFCRGCPDTIGMPSQLDERLVDPAIVERKMPGQELTTGDRPGWSWLELDLIDEEAGGATRAQRDALKLLAVLIQHTDSKPEQQRLVCVGAADGSPSTPCEHPFMMINDLGLTFGRANLANSNLVGSVNLQEWAQTSVWKEDGACVGNLPKSLTGTLKDPIISEEGREFLAQRLIQLSDSQIRALFDVARVDERAAPVGGRASSPVDDWVRVFKAKRQEIVDRRCDALWPGGISALFGTAPIRWLQDRSSSSMTAVMNGISLLGYTRVLVAIGVALAFLYKLRAGAALLLLLALTGVLTDGAKAIVSSPRPQAVDAQVRNLDFVYELGDSFRSDSATPSVDLIDGYGFPSGHVAMSAAFLLGLGYFFRWRWIWLVTLVWIPAMAVSRVYLGRHFVGDVLGGLGIGVIAATIGFLGLTLARLANEKRATNAAARTLAVAAGCACVAMWAGIGAYDAGRFVGLAAAVMVLVQQKWTSGLVSLARTADNASVAVRVGRLALAALAFAAVWRATYATLDAVGLLHTLAGALLAGAIPAFTLLLIPLVIERLLGAARGRGFLARGRRRRLARQRA
jgi:membrane-associated phospholipid phosphatase